jgi:S-adenosylmethionine/arginine decarboxylase-like enzyme
MEESKKPYGYELIIDMHGCDVSRFNRRSIEEYMETVCEAIGMVRKDLHFWDYQDLPLDERPKEPHLLGTSAVQFISTSSIIIHMLDKLKAVYVNIFTCKPFDRKVAEELTRKCFAANEGTARFIERI